MRICSCPLAHFARSPSSALTPVPCPLAPLPAPQVYCNGKRVPIKSFQDYVDLYLGPKDGGVPRVYERFSDRWEVCFATTDGQMNQVCGAGRPCEAGQGRRAAGQGEGEAGLWQLGGRRPERGWVVAVEECCVGA